MENNKPQISLAQLQQQFPVLHALHVLGMDKVVGGGGEQKLKMLLETLVTYHQNKATGAITIDYSNGKISCIDTRVRITANTSERPSY